MQWKTLCVWRHPCTEGIVTPAIKHADRRRYSQIIERYLSDCYARRTAARVPELAQLLETPAPYLSRVIPQLFGKTLRALLREKQLEEAKRLLRTRLL